MPNRNTTKASTTMRTAWTKRERKRLMPGSFQRQQEGHEVDVFLRRQRLTEHRRHHALRIARDGAQRRRVEDLAHDVLGRLDLGDLRQVGTDLRRADLDSHVPAHRYRSPSHPPAIARAGIPRPSPFPLSDGPPSPKMNSE